MHRLGPGGPRAHVAGPAYLRTTTCGDLPLFGLPVVGLEGAGHEPVAGSVSLECGEKTTARVWLFSGPNLCCTIPTKELSAAAAGSFFTSLSPLGESTASPLTLRVGPRSSGDSFLGWGTSGRVLHLTPQVLGRDRPSFLWPFRRFVRAVRGQALASSEEVPAPPFPRKTFGSAALEDASAGGLEDLRGGGGLGGTRGTAAHL